MSSLKEKAIKLKKYFDCLAEELVNNCTICFDEVDKNSSQLTCKHKFHSNCLNEWIRHGNNICPNCRKIINENRPRINPILENINYVRAEFFPSEDNYWNDYYDEDDWLESNEIDEVYPPLINSWFNPFSVEDLIDQLNEPVIESFDVVRTRYPTEPVRREITYHYMNYWGTRQESLQQGDSLGLPMRFDRISWEPFDYNRIIGNPLRFTVRSFNYNQLVYRPYTYVF